MHEKQYAIFSLDKEQYGIDILKVREINRLKQITITKVPKVPDFIEGIINLRGEAVPIINLRKKIGVVPKGITKLSRAIIVNIDEMTVGILVDEIICVESFNEMDMVNSLEEIKVNHEYIIEIGKKEKRMIFMLDIEKLIKGK